MKLIDLLVQELPKRGGWPKGASYAVQHSHDLGLNWVIFGSGDCNLIHKSSEGCWRPEGGFCFPHEYDFKANILCDDHDTLVNREQYEVALAASKQPEWDGEGLPPVGCECEAFDGVSWFPVVIVGRYDGFAFAWNYDYRKTLTVNEEHSSNFRPIRTEAERKRDDVVDSIVEHYIGYHGDPKGGEAYIDRARALYAAIAAGKIPGIKLAD